MSASSISSARRAPVARSGPYFGRVVAAEWTKLLALRSSMAIAVATVALTGGLTHVFAGAASGDPGFVPTRNLTDALPLAFLGPLLLGVLVGTGEFGTGTFRSTFAAVPRRVPVLAAQALVTAVFTVGIAVLSVGAAVLAILPAAASRDMSPDLAGAGIPQLVLGTVVYLVAMSLLGLAIGALVRRPVPALVIAFAVVVIAPIVLSLAVGLATGPVEALMQTSTPPGTAVVNTVDTFTPAGAGGVVVSPGGGGLDGAPDLGMVGAALVLAAWVTVPLAVAAYRLRRRDLA